MAVLTAQGISRVAIELLSRRLVLARTVSQIPGEEFRGGNGDTITVRVPQPSTALEQATPGASLTAQDVDEVPVEVQMLHQYHLKNITDQEMQFDLENFARQVTLPQVESVAIKAEKKLADVMNALAATSAGINWDATSTEADDKDTILQARKYLNDRDVPMEDRYLAVSTSIAMRLLKHDFLSRVDASGSGSALREAILGRVFGFNVIEAPALDTDEAVAYHKSGFVFATAAPVAPRGASESGSASSQGIALRQVFQYNASTATDQSLLSCYAGAAAVYEDSTGTDEGRFVKIVLGT